MAIIEWAMANARCGSVGMWAELVKLKKSDGENGKEGSRPGCGSRDVAADIGGLI